MHALHTIEQQRPTRRRRARRALVVAAVPHFAITRTDASGKKTAYTYNALGQVLTAQNPEVTYSHSYDSAQRLASITDSRGAKKISYAYSPGGLLNAMSDNEGRRTDYLYDATGRLSGIWAPNDDYVAYVYDAGGRLTEKWFPNGLSAQYTWNQDSTLAKLSNRFNYSDTFVVSQHEYSYNGVGQRKDAIDRLGAFVQPAANEAYAYDPLGNRRSRNNGSSQLYYGYDTANQLKEIRQNDVSGALVTAMIYDANGNLTQKCEGGAITANATSCNGASVTSLGYDALNQLAQVNKNGQISQYAYDDAGRRINKTVNGATMNYLYNGPDIQAEYQGWSKANVYYTHGPNTDDPVIRQAANDANYFHQDGLGSVIATTDVSGSLTAAQLYDAWGRPQATASLGNLGQYGYTGREPDETGMMFYRARYYDPSIGRFTQRDPIGLADGINRYAYVANDPVNLTDPSGEVGIIGGLIGGGAELLGQYVESRINGTTFVPDYGRVTVAAFAGAAGAGLVTAGNRLAQGASFLAKAGRVGVGVTVESASNIGQSLANGEQVTLGGIGLAAVLGGASARFGELAQTGFYASRGAQNVGSEADRLRRIAGSRIEDGLPRPGRVDARLNAARALDDSLDSSAKLRSEATASAIGFTEGVINRDPYINYFSNMLGTGGSGNQTLLGVSPRY